ncbi:hypothetical protein [Kitasatospora sp. Root107]|uniref:hypothetical protein n=1 Tax=Kitasatospora sp. Root107 TaxID=1736424 RepID=UPI000B0970C8|nr:hypothetical protein [Kitasatospora sp. Root107]
MISYGLDLQKVYVLTFALSQNATSHHLRLERGLRPDTDSPQPAPHQAVFAPTR